MKDFEINLNYTSNNSNLFSSLFEAQKNESKLLNVIFIVIYSIIFIIGFISNFLVIYFVLVYKRMQTMTNKFLTNLAVADLLVVLICVPVTIGRLYNPHEYIFGEFICKCSSFIQGISLSVSILTLTVISADRYYIIYKPFKARVNCTNNKIKVVVCLIWIISVFIMSPFLIVNKIQSPLKKFNIDFQICIEEWPYYEIRLVYDILLFIILFVLPLAFISYAYMTISHVLWNVEEQLIESSINFPKLKCEINQLQMNRKVSLQRSLSSNILDNNRINGKLNTFNSCRNIHNEIIELKRLNDGTLHPVASLKSFIGSASSLIQFTKDSTNTQSLHHNSIHHLPILTVEYLNKKSAEKLNIKTCCVKKPNITRNNKKVASMRNQMKNLIKNRRGIVKLLIVLVILFVISWLPYHLVSLLIEILYYIEISKSSDSMQHLSPHKLDNLNATQTKAHEVLTEYVHPVTLCLALANSATNPVCYCILSNGFRKMFKINFFKLKKTLFNKRSNEINNKKK